MPGILAGGPDLSEATISAITSALEEGRLDETIPAATPTRDGVGIMFEDGAYEWFTKTAAARAPSWRNEVRIGAPAEPHDPLDHLTRVKVPLLLIVAPDDRLTPPGEAMKVASAVPLIEIVEIPGGHFDAYQTGFVASSGPAVSWFMRYLAS